MALGGFRYNFPEYALDTDMSRQTAKVLEEVCEVFMALCNGEGRDRVAEEAMDAAASLEKIFRMLESQGADLSAVKRQVIEKNRARGYYGGSE